MKPNSKIDLNKRISLSQKEINRADNDWTIIRRKQPAGSYWVVAVNVVSGLPHDRGYIVKTKEEVSGAVEQVNRWLSKMSLGGKAAHRGRMRRHEQARQDKQAKMGESIKITKSQLCEMIRGTIREQMGYVGDAIVVVDVPGRDERYHAEFYRRDKASRYIQMMIDSGLISPKEITVEEAGVELDIVEDLGVKI